MDIGVAVAVQDHVDLCGRRQIFAVFDAIDERSRPSVMHILVLGRREKVRLHKLLRVIRSLNLASIPHEYRVGNNLHRFNQESP